MTALIQTNAVQHFTSLHSMACTVPIKRPHHLLHNSFCLSYS